MKLSDRVVKVRLSKVKIVVFIAFLFFMAVGFSYSDDQYCDQIHDAVGKIKERLPLVRTTPEDLSLPLRWNLPHTMPAVENLLNHPVEAPVEISQWLTVIQQSSSSAELVQFAHQTFFKSEKKENKVFKSVPVHPLLFERSLASEHKKDPQTGKKLKKILTPSLKNSVQNIIFAIKNSLPVLKNASSGLTQDEKSDVLKLYDFSADEKENETESIKSPRFKKKVFKSLEKFSQDDLLNASGKMTGVIEDEMTNLAQWSRNLSSENFTENEFVRFETEIGDVVIAGKGNNRYSSEFLKNVIFLLDAGGENHYEGNTASARDEEIKVVIDFGSDVSIISTQNVVSAGSGIFGIGLLYLPNFHGDKTIITNSYSQGMGLCGVGGCFVNGKGFFKSNRFSQGVGIFGVGIFSNRSGENSSYETNLYGQGVGFTRGVGIFSHQGSNSNLYAGLVDPDPRESLGATSLCQGVGYGPRAYAGGGMGFCALKGDHLNVESSYFAQGAGYWHAAGVFMIEGNSNLVKARRYDQGSGIHNALGTFFLNGNRNHTMNWGVGPAYGWDAGIGWAVLTGNENKVQTEWGTGTANLNNSRSFSFFSGDNNQLDLPGIGSSQWIRDLPDYSLSVIEGNDTFFKHSSLKKERIVNGKIYLSPWGMVDFNCITLKESVGLPKSQWRRFAGSDYVEKKRIDPDEEIRKSLLLSPEEKIESLIRIASAFSLDKKIPKKAMSSVLASDQNETDAIVESLDPVDVEGFVSIRVMVSILGDNLSSRIFKEFENEISFERKAYLMSLLTSVKSGKAIPFLLQALEDQDWRIQSAASRMIGMIYSNDPGSQPGRFFALKMIKKYLESGYKSDKTVRKTAEALSRMFFIDSASVFSLARNPSVQERQFFLDCAPEDITTGLSVDNAKRLLEYLKEKKNDALKNIKEEVDFSENMKNVVRNKLTETLLKCENSGQDKIAQRNLIHSIVTALGKIGDDRDISVIGKFTNHSSSLVRDGSCVALGKIGKKSLPVLKTFMKSSDPQRRIQALISALNGSDPVLLSVIKKGLKDKNPEVRQTAIAVIEQIQPSLKKEQDQIRETAKEMSLETVPEAKLQKIYLYGD